MKGQILGFDGETGAISGEDGARYGFAAADWKGPQPPRPREQVDFVANAGAAGDIYPIRRGGLSGLAPSIGDGVAEGGVGAFAARPQLALAAGALIVSLLVPIVHFGRRETATAVGYPGIIEDAVNLSSTLSILHALSFLLWLIPLGAALVIFTDLSKPRKPGIEIATGILCLVPVAIHLAVMASVPVPFSVLKTLSVGMYLLVLIGVGLILTGSGRLTRIPGL